MRNTCFKALVLGMAVAAWALSQMPVSAQTLLYNMTSTWKYMDNGTNFGTYNWKTNSSGFSESGWSDAVAGPFGFEDGFAIDLTPVAKYVPGSTTTQVITYYFRNRFSFTGNPTGASLMFSNIIDDGAVFYLNGVEIYSFNMPAGPYTSTTQARGTTNENQYVVVTVPLPANLLKVGQNANVMAVEVHQSGTASSDLVFGSAAWAVLPSPIVITQQPVAEQEVPVGARATFSVTALGTDPVYRWYKTDSTTKVWATTPTFSLNSLVLTNAGTYYCIVSNALNNVRSANSVLRVVNDVFPPELVSAEATEGKTNQITLTFDEGLRLYAATNFFSPQNPANYTISIMGSNHTVVSNLTVMTNIASGGVIVRLNTIQGLNPTNQYMVTVRNVMDAYSNKVSVAQIGVSFVTTTNLVAFNGMWSYSPWGVYTNANWNKVNYYEDPWDWTPGVAPLFFSQTRQEACFGPIENEQQPPLGTELTIGWPTYYFRKLFVVPNSFSNTLSAARLTFKHYVDDGAVFYINGVELPNTRYNLPSGAITYTTPPTAPLAQGAAVCVTNANLALPNLVVGTNVFAVEVKDDMNNIEDIMFAVELDLVLRTAPYQVPAPPQSPKLNYTFNRTTKAMTFTWTNKAFMLEVATNTTKPGVPAKWTSLSTNSPYIAPVQTSTNIPYIYRLRY